MIYDGIFLKAQINEIKKLIVNEHIARITENEQKEINIHIRRNGKNFALSLSVNPNFPHILLTENEVDNFAVPPAFCMLLRKYLQGGLIIDINSGIPENELSLERIIDIKIQNINDKGDIKTYHLFIEIMGRYSNIIITDSDLCIIDVLLKSDDINTRLKIKEKYSVEKICTKREILLENEDSFTDNLNDYAGISKARITDFDNMTLSEIKNKINTLLTSYNDTNIEVTNYIAEKLKESNKSTEIKNIETIIKNLYTKLSKKVDNYKKDIFKCENLEIHKTYGDLIAAFGYNADSIKNGVLTCEDYKNDNKLIEVPIDTAISIAENINKYYDKYNKLKRTKENATTLLNETLDKVEHLNTIAESIKLSTDKNDVYLIKEELIKYFDETNKVQKLHNQKINAKMRNNKINKSKNNLNYNIHHYKSSNGIDIYVGKNNLQNEYLTFTLASPTDTWLHIKNATGSHVIVKKPYEELDDKTLIEAASLAAYFSEKRSETKATVDYTLRKELKKVKGKAPGFCIYHKNYSINVKPEIIIDEI